MNRGASTRGAGNTGGRGGGSNNNNASNNASIDYMKDAELMQNFLQNFSKPFNLEDLSDEEVDDIPDDDDTTATIFKYKILLQKIADRKISSLSILLDDLIDWSDQGRELAKKIKKNTVRYLEITYKVVDQILPAPSFESVIHNDVVDVLIQQRQRVQESQHHNQENNAPPVNQAAGGGENPAAPTRTHQRDVDTTNLPKALERRYQLYFTARDYIDTHPLRNVKAKQIGHLVKIQGIVTRLSEVKPLITIATYTCQECGFENYQEIKSREFMPLKQCTSRVCKQKKGKGPLELQTRGSKFIKFQELKIQELPDQVPIGHTPRALTVHTMGDLTRICSAGDIVTITGIFLPTPYSGWQAIKAGLIADTYLQAMAIEKKKKSYSNYDLSERSLLEIARIAKERGIYERLASSIAPEIFGHENVKKALLLLMVGAATKEMKDGMRIRGDINICLMGDPGVAKSQLLRHIAAISPRGVYTSGKGASGVGLTAAVIRDPVSREFVLEGGSLVLADMGICCIDEFDKMEESDRTAIHEVMEQQTISISKAGINTTLNARTSILAAANPAFGRYNPKRSPSENINLPAALLSRFDLLFLILDKSDYEKDLALANHVTYVHMHGHHPETQQAALTTDTMKTYISQARKFEPYVPEDLTQYIVGAYVKIRQLEASAPDQYSYTTARTLLSILRLSQSLARLAMRNVVTQDDVDEAIRLLDVSQSSLDDKSKKNANVTDPISAIYDIIRNFAVQNQEIEIQMSEIIPRVLAKGFTQQQLNQCLDEYERFQVWTVASDQSSLTFI